MVITRDLLLNGPNVSGSGECTVVGGAFLQLHIHIQQLVQRGELITYKLNASF